LNFEANRGEGSSGIVGATGGQGFPRSGMGRALLLCDVGVEGEAWDIELRGNLTIFSKRKLAGHCHTLGFGFIIPTIKRIEKAE